MWADKLLDLVKKMRRVQRCAFVGNAGLDECRELEKKLDRFILTIQGPFLFGEQHAHPTHQAAPR